jgi:hypothetical protein
MSKRRYHHNHFLLAKNILQTFQIPVKEAHALDDEYFDEIKNANPEIREGVIQLLVLGFIIDGNLSSKERATLNRLHKDGVIDYDVHKIKQWMHSFVKGKGLDELLTTKK